MYILNVLPCALAWMHIHAALDVIYIFLFSHLFVSNVNTVMNFPSLCRVWAYCCSAPVCCCWDLEKYGFGYFWRVGGSVSALLKTSNRGKKGEEFCFGLLHMKSADAALFAGLLPRCNCLQNLSCWAVKFCLHPPFIGIICHILAH